ncbi:MAG: methylenetetrahydrofolate reductase [Thermoplasmata archaeon]|nr:MAG: methylenetetrahydrofolate reductase [Thermoplasmata archaeon]RLF53536.1 MAG: methylenetetrahydrofolate reductase [Thermoplasmata archaeon]
MKYKSNLERVLVENNFAVTAEVGPPKGADADKVRVKGEILKGYADAFNVTDNQTAVVRLSSLAGSVILLNMGLEPIMQVACRDRNRIAIQSDVLGAASLGIRNILFITGDHQSFGNHPGAKGVYDLDSIQLIKVVKDMRDNGVFQSGDKIVAGKPDVFIGGVANPFAEPYEFRVDRLEMKINAGVDFIQTQSVFNLERFNIWMDEVRGRGLDKRVHILAGVTPLKSLKMTERMKFHVPGVDVPDDVYFRMKKAEDPQIEGFKIALELIDEIKKIKGVHGVHITALFWEEVIPRLVKESNFLPRP